MNSNDVVEQSPSEQEASTKAWVALAAMAVLLVSIGLDLTVLNVALPNLAVDLRATSSDLQWFVNAYALVMAASLLPAGRLGDRFGPRVLIVGSALVFGLSSAACAWAPSATWLILARGLMGAAAGFYMPLSMSMLTRMFSGSDRSRAISLWTVAVALGIPIGPLLGGWLLDHFWWGSVFVINIPLTLVAVAGLAATLPSTRPDPTISVDVPGAVLSSVGFVLLTYGFTRAGDTGWGESVVLSALGAGVVLTIAFLLWLRRGRHPLFPLSIFQSPQFLWGCVMATLASLVMMTTIFVVPQYAQVWTDTNALGVGLRLLPFIGGLVFAVPVAEQIIKRTTGRYRVVVALGFVLAAAGSLLASRTGPDSSTSYVLVWSGLLGAGVGFALPNSMDLAMSVMDSTESGTGSGVVQCLRQLGGSFGVAVLGTIMVGAYRHGLATDGLPPEAAEAVRSSPSLGAVVARRSQMTPLLSNVQNSFLSGMELVFTTLAVLALLTALVAAVRVPRDPGDHLAEAAGGF